MEGNYKDNPYHVNYKVAYNYEFIDDFWENELEAPGYVCLCSFKEGCTLRTLFFCITILMKFSETNKRTPIACYCTF